ncbi:MAG: polysaccharide biosynthesis protein [Clostridia bacterium]|nr:polysaccharide biosynthesis protein [Clostridia bacterium]
MRKTVLIIADYLSVTVAMSLAFVVCMHGTPLGRIQWIIVAANMLLNALVFWLAGLYSVGFSSVGVFDAIKSCFAVGIILLVNEVFVVLSSQQFMPYTVPIVYALLLFCFTVGVRFSKRALGVINYYITVNKNKPIQVMVIGAGEAGVMLIKEMVTSTKVSYHPVCILDDDLNKLGKTIYNVKVVGQIADVQMYVTKYKIDEIFVAMPSVGAKRLGKIAQECNRCNCPVKILPGLYQIANGQVSVSQLRNVEVADLLGREQINVNIHEIMGYIEEKTVLVTGGGGSIGSELCRQIASHNPKLLIILDSYENGAYEIEQELKRTNPKVSLLTLVASIRDYNRMRDIFEKYRPQIVFHAAAHKHVPLMETSPHEAVKNNVFGTINVASCANEFGVETFVQISTDKAVNPTNVMGATKRICEMIVQTFGRHSEKTNFVAVRFGNVLGSNGSVIPLFKKQIAEGGPVTVTHKDIIRYFMTIPEAVSLVLQAGVYAQKGQIFVLDMGEPVRIYDLAYNLIKLSGYEPNVDIPIVCTGLRPGEKLFEERLMEEEGLQQTENGLISIAKPLEIDEEYFKAVMEELRVHTFNEHDDVKETIKKIVPTYQTESKGSKALEQVVSMQEEAV